MKQTIGLTALVVRDYDEALKFYVGLLGFTLIEDTYIAGRDKRWVVVAPSICAGAALVLAVPSDERQRSRVGDQTGGRVGLFLHSDDFWRDYENLHRRGVTFLEKPRHEPYGVVAVFVDPWGGKWDLLQPASGALETP